METLVALQDSGWPRQQFKVMCTALGMPQSRNNGCGTRRKVLTHLWLEAGAAVEAGLGHGPPHLLQRPGAHWPSLPLLWPAHHLCAGWKRRRGGHAGCVVVRGPRKSLWRREDEAALAARRKGDLGWSHSGASAAGPSLPHWLCCPLSHWSLPH